MKVKKILPILALAVLTACEDKIDIDNRYSPTATPEPARMILVEEYTGTRCVNCPNGHVALEALEEYYNTEKNLEQNIGIITVGVHIPNWGYTVAQGGFITPEAGDLTPDGITPPQAQINRNGKVLNRADWGKEISIEIARKAQVSFPDRVSATVGADGIRVKGQVLADEVVDDVRLHVWVVENNITFRQFMPDGSRKDDYVHQNVYRAHMTDSYSGADFPLTRNTVREFSYTYPVNEKWNPENLNVVVFLESPGNGVLNATKVPVVKQ